MLISSSTFEDGQVIPERCGFGRKDPERHFAFSDNRNPQLSWSQVPAGAKSLVLLCVDTDVPTRPDDVNQEDRTVSAELPRTDFYHWVMIDIPVDCSGVDEGACSSSVTPGGKIDPPGPDGSRQGVTDYTNWFAGDPDMGGTYRGYDGPAPPWNDELIHHYHFRLFALDIDRCPVKDDFTATDVIATMEGHVLEQARITGTYTLNPALG